MEVPMPALKSSPPVGSAPLHRPHRTGKRATNLSLSTDVLDSAKQLNINISQVCDAYLRELVRSEQERRWRQEHADFVGAYNDTLHAEGLPLEEWKSF
jgi:antitoxin CcdA